VTTRYDGGPDGSAGEGSATVQVAYPSLAAAYTDVGVTDDANPAPGNLDGAGFSFSAQALGSVGVVPGVKVTSGPATFTWPDIPAGQPDTVTTAGQSIALRGSGTVLSLIAVGTNGTQIGPVTVTYADGSTSTSTVTVADWYSNQPVSGCVLVTTAPYWNRPVGSTYPRDQKVSLYAASVTLTASKRVAFVTLPTNRGLHVFATAFTY
jgi:beta-glucosidase